MFTGSQQHTGQDIYLFSRSFPSHVLGSSHPHLWAEVAETMRVPPRRVGWRQEEERSPGKERWEQVCPSLHSSLWTESTRALLITDSGRTPAPESSARTPGARSRAGCWGPALTMRKGSVLGAGGGVFLSFLTSPNSRIKRAHVTFLFCKTLYT